MERVRRLVLVLALVLVFALPVPALPLLGVPADAQPRTAVAAERPTGIFNVVCGYSHTSGDDPIAMPGMPGMAMSHDFYGNRRTDAHSTAASLLADGATTCTAPADHADCWDGTTLAGASQANAAYAGPARGCPASHPVRIPELVAHVKYPGTGRFDDLRASLAPGEWGSVYSVHMDFFNAWDTEVLARLVQDCNVGQQHCGTIRETSQRLLLSQGLTATTS